MPLPLFDAPHARSDEGTGGTYTYFDRELSWLAFNERVLQEAQRPDVPLYERLHFLAIFSSNLDEFFRVRVASIRSLLRLKRKQRKKLDFDPETLLREIRTVVLRQQEVFGVTFREQLLPELEARDVVLVDERAVQQPDRDALRVYFRDRVLPVLRPVLLERTGEPPFLKNKGLYLVTELWERTGTISLSALEARYALVEIPSPPLPRFVVVPGDDEAHRVMFLDDLIRLCMPDLYPAYDVGASYAVKLSRDADLYLDDEFSGNLKEMILKSLARRETGTPTRFLYDLHMPQNTLLLLKERLALEDEDLIEGGRYHNLNDLASFPRFDLDDVTYGPMSPVAHPDLEVASLFDAVRAKDRLLHVPYQSFQYVIRLLEEAGADPNVEALYITLYRVAEDSSVARALIQAAERGKRVTAFVEAKARFDEATNLQWAHRMEEAGVDVLYSMPGLKVHAKLALIVRREKEELRRYAYLGTGNFNEKTARVYSDVALLTADPRLTGEVERVFDFLSGKEPEPVFEHLLVAPFNMREGLYALIDREANHARTGGEARFLLKVNNLEDREIIARLYEASRAGVLQRLVVRGICCLVPGVPGQSERIQVTSIVDRFLEHARIYVFHNGGNERIYLASADWMKRNLSHRVEVAFPIYDDDLRTELGTVLRLQTSDNTKARIVDTHQKNAFVDGSDNPPIRAQYDTYRFLKERHPNAPATEALHSVVPSAK